MLQTVLSTMLVRFLQVVGMIIFQVVAGISLELLGTLYIPKFKQLSPFCKPLNLGGLIHLLMP